MTCHYAGVSGMRPTHFKKSCSYNHMDTTVVAPLSDYEEYVAGLRTSRLNPRMLRRAVIAVRSGTTKTEACRACGFSTETFNKMPEHLK